MTEPITWGQMSEAVLDARKILIRAEVVKSEMFDVLDSLRVNDRSDGKRLMMLLARVDLEMASKDAGGAQALATIKRKLRKFNCATLRWMK